MAKQDDWVRLTVRLPPELYQSLNERSAQGGASMNAEIIARLQTSLGEVAHQIPAVDYDAFADAVAESLLHRLTEPTGPEDSSLERRMRTLGRLGATIFGEAPDGEADRAPKFKRPDAPAVPNQRVKKAGEMSVPEIIEDLIARGFLTRPQAPADSVKKAG